MASRPNLPELWGSKTADEIYESQFVDWGLTNGKETLPVGETGFNLTKLMRYHGERRSGFTPVEQPDGKNPGKHDDYGVVRVDNWVDGWGKFIEEQFGHRNALLASMPVADETDVSGYVRDEPETMLEKTVSAIDKGATDVTKTVNSGVVQGATPILIDPEVFNTVRQAAPINNVVDTVVQAGFTASYNVISGRDAPSPGWTDEAGVRDLTGESGSAYTMPNSETGMDIWADTLDVSDFSARAQSSLDFMDLGATSLEIRTQEYGTRQAKMLYYGDPSQDEDNGSVEDGNAPNGLRNIADTTTGKSGNSLDGDKPLFEDIKSEINGLVKSSAANHNNLVAMTSIDMFDALENEANVNVRLDSFDGGLNFGRAPGPNTLSIASVPVIPDPNVREYDDLTGASSAGDVFIFDTRAVQFRALQTLSALPLAQTGLSNRTALFQYGAPIDRSQGAHTLVLQDYDVPTL